VRLNTPVRSVGTDGGVMLLDGSEIHADAVVAAVPLPVLSRLWPEMPDVLASVGYGVGGKISVQFSRRIWRDYGRSGTVLSDRSWGHLWETTDDQAGDAGVLTNLLASHDGAAFAALPEAPTQLVREIDRLFPGAAGLAGERVHTDWTNDPFSLGTYACFGPGQLETAGRAMLEPYGRLLLAGEHTCTEPGTFPGFMEGALRSGAAAAAHLLA
jgi:monoamine oxidase